LAVPGANASSPPDSLISLISLTDSLSAQGMPTFRHRSIVASYPVQTLASNLTCNARGALRRKPGAPPHPSPRQPRSFAHPADSSAAGTRTRQSTGDDLQRVVLNGVPQPGGEVLLVDDGREHIVEIVVPRVANAASLTPA
jgi:hypothetical protein